MNISLTDSKEEPHPVHIQFRHRTPKLKKKISLKFTLLNRFFYLIFILKPLSKLRILHVHSQPKDWFNQNFRTSRQQKSLKNQTHWRCQKYLSCTIILHNIRQFFYLLVAFLYYYYAKSIFLTYWIWLIFFWFLYWEIFQILIESLLWLGLCMCKASLNGCQIFARPRSCRKPDTHVSGVV